ncbi:hypothetical protein [Kribbella soli]|uniref:DUF2726 domain-containing protein n=1 Tax=Kribbella soli TaxID=1124743 RepID=A0A4R0GV44_9ACTN|nr:hypothetical protein [Kribbella soli]TCC01845.1 hypothetical protein E0H45_40970 [Kribbella soli]
MLVWKDGRFVDKTREASSWRPAGNGRIVIVYGTRPVLGIEVDGFKYHENNPEQLRRDALKDGIFAAHRMPLLRLPTTGSAEAARIRAELDRIDM